MIDTHSAKHYQWGERCDGWHLVNDPTMSVIEERMPPGTSEVRHLHGNARQFFYVLAGTLTFELDGNEIQLAAGQGQEVTPGLAHRVFNRSGSDVRLLVISCPPTHSDRVVVD